jgi:hypothetical protein
LLQDVRGPADHAAGGKRRGEHLRRDAAQRHDDARVELDVRVEVAARLELGEHVDHRLLDLDG